MRIGREMERQAPSYWLNEADYELQNICNKYSRANLMSIFRRRRGGETTNLENTSPDGFLLDSVEIEAGKQRKKPSTRLRHAYANSVAAGHPVSYFKGAYGKVLLHEQILGTERFDWTFRKLLGVQASFTIRFFRAMESGPVKTWAGSGTAGI